MRTKLHLRTLFWSNNVLLETTKFEDLFPRKMNWSRHIAKMEICKFLGYLTVLRVLLLVLLLLFHMPYYFFSQSRMQQKLLLQSLCCIHIHGHLAQLINVMVMKSSSISGLHTVLWLESALQIPDEARRKKEKYRGISAN